MSLPCLVRRAALLACAGAAPLLAQAPDPEPRSAGSDSASLVAQGQKLATDGKPAEALALYRRALAINPNDFEAHVASGVALDLEGRYPEARSHLNRAIALASNDSVRARALRPMAISYAFTRDAGTAAKYEQQVVDAAIARKDYTGAADVDNEMARIYLESGDLANAYKWYQSGHETALRKAGLTQAERDLWDFRWEHAEARIAARRGQRSEAEKHVAAAKSILDRGTNPDQKRFFPYLTGYVALYLGDYKAAIADLQGADQHDPFILSLIAQAYEKSGDAAHAKDYYRRVLVIYTHNPPGAFARPLATQKLAAG